jgi:(5-formylfuran-3-yl)methyl phosphate synthase
MARYRKHEAQEWAWEALRGQWTTLITPFTPDNELDERGLRHNIRHTRKLGTTGAGCTWGMGEFWSLTFDERLRVMDIVADESNGQWHIGAHVTHTSAEDMLALAKHAEAASFDLLMVAPPYMVTKTEEQVVNYVKLLADNTSLAIMFYNSPQFGMVMSPQGLKRLCQIPNVVGVKEASFNQQLSIETHLLLGKDAIISTPDEWIFYKAKELGFQQQVMFANTSDWRFDTPECNYYVQFIENATRGDLNEKFYNARLKDIKALSDKWWGSTVKKFGGALPVAMCKYWGEVMGMAGGHVRQPLADLTAEEKTELKQELTPLMPKPRVEAAPARARAHAPWLNGEKDVTFSGMMLLVSVQNMDEALEADQGGADIIDVKNLQEALVGSGHPNLVEEVRARIPAKKHVSVTLGVVPNQVGTVAMAVRAAAMLDATSVKVGFCQTDYDTAVETLRESRRALKGYNTKLIGSLFADNHLFNGLEPRLMVKLAKEGECDGFLIDTLTKDGRNLFDFIPEHELREMVFEAKQQGLSTALSGHLRLENLDELARINPDIVGVRGAVCRSGERDRAVAWEAVAHFKRELDRRKSGEINVYERTATATVTNGSGGGWAVVDGRGKNCAGVIAALTRQIESDQPSLIEAILHDALNIYDVIYWAEQSGHRLVTQRKEPNGILRVLIQPHGNGHA